MSAFAFLQTFEGMNDALDLSRLRALHREKPNTVMGLIRLAWPDIRAALDRGHSLRVVHERLVEAGIPVEYRQLSAYIGRIERRTISARPASELPRPVVVHHQAIPKAQSPSAADPLANVRERTENPPGFHFEDGPADESKLI